MIAHTTSSPLFPYTTLFRSQMDRLRQVSLADVHRVATTHVDPEGLAIVVVGDRGVIEEGQTTTMRSEEHTSELQSLRHLVCRLLLEKKKGAKAAWIEFCDKG